MTALTIQRMIAAIFLVLGGWALLAPASVVDLTIMPAYREHSFLVHFAMAAFGAQACLFGAMAMVVRFGPMGFLLLATLLVPFFVFDWYFQWIEPVLTPVGMLDLAGNLAMFAMCIAGWRKAKAEVREA